MNAYVDVILLKSRAANTHLGDLKETFNNNKKNLMWLKPSKHDFGVGFGRFLEFMIHRGGIDANM